MNRSVMLRAALVFIPIAAIAFFAIAQGVLGESVDPVLVVLGIGCLICIGGALLRGYRNGWMG